MRRILRLLLVGAALGAAAWGIYRLGFQPTLTEQTKKSAAETKATAVGSAREVGGLLEDTALIALIKGKYVVDRDLSSLAIGVECTHGHVTLSGTVGSRELIARATELARHTPGVTGVTSRLTVKNQ